MVQEVLDEQKNAPANVLRILNTVSKHNNTPRKKPKFINFVKNVCGHKTNPKDIDAAWDMISVKLAALALNRNQNVNKYNQEDKDNDGNIEEEQEVSSTSDAVTTNGTAEETAEKKNGEIEIQTEEKGKKSKKQRKEEKKRQKYEAELQSAGQVPSEEDEAEQKPKKEKKKNKGDINGEINGDDAESNKKKRKRQDTINELAATAEAAENAADMPQIQNLQVTTEKTKKKKPKIDQEEVEDDQNVAYAEDNDAKAEKFNWHAVIMSVLEKKGNEVPFKRLQKKVLGEYSEVTGREVDDRIADKFIKKLKSAPNVRVDKNKVLLVQ